jgi:membrane protein
MFSKIIYFFQHGVWQGDDLVRPFKIALYTMRGIGQHDIFIRASSLTYYTILSIVPIAALIFGFMRGFGFDERLWAWVYEKFPGEEAFIDNYLREFIENMLVHTRGGVIAAVGMAVLFWAVIRVFTTVEDSFNNIWEVKQSRSIARMLSDYLSVVVVAPILLISASALTGLVRSHLEPWVWSWLLNVVFAFAELLLMWLLFAFIYWVMPNTRVKFKGAMIAGVIAGTIFWVFSQAYFALQGSLSSNNTIYGTFAAVPLLLFWVQSSWLIVLVGAELSFAYQNIDRYGMEQQAVMMNMATKRKIMVATMAVIARHFTKGGGAVTSEQIATELELPVRSIREVVYELEQSGLAVAVKTEKDAKSHSYMPARDVHGLTVFDVINSVESDNTTHLDVSETPELSEISKLLDDAREATRKSGLTTRIVDLKV